MASSSQMRAAWSRRTDDELLHAYFLEELTPTGRTVVGELVAEKLGSIDAYVQPFADAQGELVARLPVRSCDVTADRDLPLLWGIVVLTTTGLGFVPGGHDDELGEEGPGALGHLIGGALGELADATGRSVWSQLRHTSQPVANLIDLSVPLPLIARLEPTAVWAARDTFDVLCWGPDFGEVLRAGQRVFAAEADPDAEPIVAKWAAARGVTLHSVAGSPLLR